MDSRNFTLETQLRTDSYLYLLAFTFLYYDHFLTFDAEVRFIWSRLSKFSSRLFLINRYFSFGGNIVILLSMFFAPAGASSCHPWEEFQEFFHAFVQVIVAILLTMRIVALYERDKRVIAGLVFIIVSGICATIVSLYFSDSTAAVSLFPIGCHDVLSLENSALVSTGWILVLVYDTLLFSMTLFKAYQARSQPKMKLSLFTIIIRDGSMYFGVMVIANLINVLTFFVTGDSLLRGTFSPFASCTSVTLMSRLMLHLHRVHDEGLYVAHGDTLAKPARSYDPDDTVSTMAFGDQGNHNAEESTNYTEDMTDTDADGLSSRTDSNASGRAEV
ncbi:hypothetical protein GYMLUDRAFT_38355 [Collybiopsis luxurians FD-317 M1]|nr:hypothetical protein GYMLUDRAFT_38355 [Collybiopsis luxurians FD-317 M1]